MDPILDALPNGLRVLTALRDKRMGPETSIVLRDASLVTVERHLNPQVAQFEHGRWVERASALKSGDKIRRVGSASVADEEVTIP